MIHLLRSPALAPGPGYDRVAGSYDNWNWQSFWDRNEEPLVESVLRGMATPSQALDLGTGTGRYLRLLKELGVHSAIGLDVSTGMLAVARQRRESHRLVRADMRAIPIAPNCLDLIIAARSLCHIPELDSAFRQIAVSLRPGGTLIVTELDADHAFQTTKAPTADGEVTIATWKRPTTEIVRAAAREGLVSTRIIRVRATDCRWLPPPSELSSIDRTGRRAIFSVAIFSKLSS